MLALAVGEMKNVGIFFNRILWIEKKDIPLPSKN